MVWKIDGPQGNEASKVRFDLVPYMQGRVLDLGCGPDKIFPTAIGIDNKIDAKLFGIQVDPDIAVDTCERMPLFADASVDTVFSSHLLEHIVDYAGALAEWWRILKVGGHLILYLPNNEDDVANGGYPKVGEQGANIDHKWNVTFDGVLAAMKRVGAWDLVEFEKRSKECEYSFLFVFRKGGEGFEHSYSYREPKVVAQKRLGIVRLGAFGDALWLSSVLPKFKAEGYHITLYTQPQGEVALRHDPHIDRIICQPLGLFDFPDGRVGMWQTAYWLHEEKKYDLFLNSIGSTERRLLPQPFEPDFYLPEPQRRRMMNRNYVEALHEWVGVKFDKLASRQRFYPSADELAWAAQERAKIDGRLVVINPSGSSIPKWWPFAQQLADMLAAEGMHSIIVGDLRATKFRAAGKFGRVVGNDWPIRKVWALAAMADAVVGTESALVNAVAYEEPLKVVLMSHSTHENLTRDWRNTVAIEPEGLRCYPCHRIHTDMIHCTYDRENQAAACQSAVKPEQVLAYILEFLELRERKELVA
jgi:ADP-heptose:LPS heptosyltransferase/predicted SAM-dependent methyltransferase